MPQDSSFEGFLRLSQEVFAEGDSETACQSLMAALDRARYLQDSQALAAVKQRASDQLADLWRPDLPAHQAAEGLQHHQSLARLYQGVIQLATASEQLVEQRPVRSAHPPHRRRIGEETDAERGEASERSR